MFNKLLLFTLARPAFKIVAASFCFSPDFRFALEKRL